MSSTHHDDSSPEPENWSVGKIKTLLKEHQIDCSGVVEKDDLLGLLRKIPQYTEKAVPHHKEHEFYTQKHWTDEGKAPQYYQDAQPPT